MVICMKRNDVYIIVVLIVFALGMFWLNVHNERSGEVVIVYYNNKEYDRAYLSEEKVIKVNDTNTVRIKDGKVFMESADCPDQICVHQKPINSSGRDIVCLPNKVVVRVISEEKEVDMVVK